MPKDYETTRTALYGMLQDAGAKGLPDTAEEFVSKLDDENTRRGLYQTLKDSNAKGLPDWDSFNARLTPSANDNETTTTTTTTINEPTQWETSSTQDNNIQGATTIDEWQPSKTVREIRGSMGSTSNLSNETLSGYGFGKNIATEEGLNKVVGDYKNLVDLQFYEKDLRNRITEEAQQMGVDPNEYTNYLKQLMVEDFRDNIIQEQVSNATPTGVMDYFKKKLGDGLIGSLLKLGRTTYQNQIDEIAKQQYEETISPWVRAIGGGLELVADAPFFGVTGKVTGAALKGIVKRQLSKYVAKGIGMAQAERLAEAEVAQSLAKRFGSHLLTQTAGSAASLGAYEGVKTAVQQQALTGETDWKDVADATLGGAITGAAIGVAGKAAHAATADLAGWRLAMGKALGFGLETGAFVTSEELNSLRKGEGFIPLTEATLESAISLAGIKLGSKLNPATWKPTITEIRSIINPSVRGTYKFSDIERKQLQQLFGQYDIFANIEKLAAEQTKAKAEGESAKTIDNSQQVEETKKAISQGLQNVLNNKELDYTTKAKLIRIVAGDDVNLPLPIIAGYDTTENDETGEYTLITRDLNGFRVQTEQFKSQKGLDERVAQLDRQIQQNVETYNDIIAKPIEDSYNEAYNIGRQTTDPQQMSAYNYAYAATQDEVRQTFSPEMIEQLDANPIGTLTDLARQAMEERETDKKEEATDRYNLAAEYVGAKRRDEGMQEGNTDRINQAVTQNDERIDSYTHKGTSGKQDDFVGLVVPVTTKGANGDVQVYVIGGEIVRNDNGTINRERSSDFINIIDEEGNVTSISPDDIISVGDPYNAEEAKRQQGEQIRQQMQQQYEDAIEGRVPFHEGDEYTLADEQGRSYSVKIIGAAVDGQGQPIEGQVVVELGDGKQQMMSREAIQDGVDRANMQRATDQTLQQTEGTTQPQEPRTYEEKEVIRVKTPDNKEVDASINKVNEDGTVEVFTADEMKFDGDEEEGNFHTFTPEQLTAIEVRREPSTIPEEIEGTALGGIPKDDNGKPLWESATPADAYTGLLEQAEGDVDDTRAVINDMLADKQDELKSAEKALSKAEKDATDEEVRKATKGMDASEKLQYRKNKRAAIEKAQQNVEKARQSADFWQKVLDEANKPAEEEPVTPQEEAVVEEQVETPAPTAEQQTNTTTLQPKRQRTTRYAKRDAALGDYVDLRDYILRFLANADHILAWSRNPRVNTMKGLSAELGYGRGELPHYRWLLRGWDKGGISVDQLAETLLTEYSEVTGIPMENLPDDTEVKNIILDILQSHSRPKAMMEEAEARHKNMYETQDPNAYEEALDMFTTRIVDEAEEMGVPVTIIKDIEELQEIAEQLGMERSIDEKIKADKPIYGWAKNNRYYLYAPDIFEEGAYNLDTALEVARDKMEHEGVVHVGMRLRLGDKGYNNLCKQIYKGMSKESRDSKVAYQWANNLDDRTREQVLEEAQVDKPTSTEWGDFSTDEKAKILSVYGDRLTQGAADEYVADIAEKIRRGEELSQKERTIWQKISDYVKKLLGKETAMTDQDIADEILATKEYLKMQKDVADKTKEREESQPQDQEEAESILSEVENQKVPQDDMIDLDLYNPLGDFDPDEEVPFSVGKGRRQEMERRLDKSRPDITPEQRKALFEYLDTLDDRKVENATFDWFVKGTIRIPEDMDKVRQAIEVAGKAKVNPTSYNSPMELLNANADFKPTKPRINPDTVPTLTNKKDYGHGITVYNVREGAESRENMRQIINSHWGEDCNPWCLLQGDGEGNLLPSAAQYWRVYSRYGKKVAFKDGKLVAFFASNSVPTWWDRNDKPHFGIPVEIKMPDDDLGRIATYEYRIPAKNIRDYAPYAGDWKIDYPEGLSEPQNIHRGNKNNGIYENWNNANGSGLRTVAQIKNGVPDGLEIWLLDGVLRGVCENKEGEREGLTIVFRRDGSMLSASEFANGRLVRNLSPNEAQQMFDERGIADKIIKIQGESNDVRFSVGEGLESEENLVNLQPKKEKEDVKRIDSSRNGVGAPIREGTQRRGTVGGGSGLVQGAKNKASRIESRNVSPRNNASGTRLDKSISRRAVREGNAEGERIISQESNFTNRIKGLTDQFNIPFVILNTPEDLEVVARRNGLRDFQDEEYLASHFVKGFVSDNVPYLYVPDILGEAIEKDIDLVTAAVRAVFHEGVSHYGLGRMLGRYYDDFCDNVYRGLSKEDREKNLAYVWSETLDDDTRTSLLNKFGKDSGTKWKDLTEGERDQVLDTVGKDITRGAADEHIANIAEKVATDKVLTKDERSFWERFTDWVRTLFGAKGLTDKEIAEAVRLSRDLYSKENGEDGEVEGNIEKAHEILDREAPETRFSVGNTASTLGRNLGIDIDTTDKGRRKRDKYTVDPQTGKISIVAENHNSPEDVERTVLTASVPQHGLRTLFGDRYDTFLDNIYSNSANSTRREMAQIATRNGWDFHKATEEYLANVAREGDIDANNAWWKYVKTQFQQMLQDKGFDEISAVGGYGEDGKLTDNDLRYVLMRNNADLEGAMGVAQDIDMQNSLGVGNYRESEPTDEEDDLTWFSVGNKRDRSGIERRKEVVDNMFNLLSHNKSNLEQRNKTLQAVSKLYQAVQTQGKYDRETVSLLVNTINDMIENNLLNPSRGETKRLLSDVKNSMDRSIGGSETNFVKSVQTLGNIIADNQLRTGRNALEEALEAKVARVDATGIKKQGEVDEQTANILKSIEGYIYGNLSRREADNLGITEYVSTEQMRDMLDEAEMDMGSSKDAAARYVALRIALDYREKVQEPNARRKEIRDDRDRQAEKWREQVEKGEITESERRKLQKEYNDDVDKVLLDSKLQSAADLYDIVNDVSDIKKEGKVRAKSFIEKELSNIEAIDDDMKRDLDGVDNTGQKIENRVQKFANSTVAKIVASPLLTYEQVFKMFGRNSADGQGFLYNRFVGGWYDSATKEASGYRDALNSMNAKASELFGEGTRYTDLYATTRKEAGNLRYFDNGEYRDHPVTQGNLLYVYMTDKMSDGAMKLRCMGISSTDVERIKETLDPRLVQLADWIQEEFLSNLREKYNDTYKNMFGVSMDNIPDYVPLRLFRDAIPNRDGNLSSSPLNMGNLATTTSAIKRRTVNNLPIDIIGTDALSLIFDHVGEMEHWNAFAPLSKDLNTLRNNKDFRARVKNMNTLYGGGASLLESVENVFRLAVGDYTPSTGSAIDKGIAKFGQTVAASKIAFRLNTALKQLASIVNYAPDVNPIAFTKALGQAFAGRNNTWNWAMENMPLFEKRWRSRTEGDTRLELTDDDFDFWKNGWLDKIRRWGITPNAFVDALTVSIGAKAMYDTKYAQYVRNGFDTEQAHEKALQDATLLYNQTQQSSERAFVSTLQVDRTIGAMAVTLFRNASMSYFRQVAQAARNLRRMMTTPRERMINSMAQQYVQEGLSNEQAIDAAERRYTNSAVRESIRLATFAFLAPLTWRVAGHGISSLARLILGGNKEDEQKQWEDDVQQSLVFGALEGVPAGQTITDELYNILKEGKPSWAATESLIPLVSDVSDVVENFRNDRNWEAMNELINLGASIGLGASPEALENAIYGLIEYCGSEQTARDGVVLYSALTSVPRSQINKIRLDEMEMSGEEALRMTPEEFVKRYADAQARYGTGILYPVLPEEEKKRYEDSAKRKLEGQIGGQQLNDDYKEAKKSFEEINQTLNEIDKNVTAKTASYGKAISNTMKGAINRNRKKAEHDKLGEGVYEQIEEIKSLQGRLNKRNNGNLRTKWWESTTPEEAQQYSDDISATMQEIIEKVNALPDDLKERAQRILEEQTKENN